LRKVLSCWDCRRWAVQQFVKAWKVYSHTHPENADNPRVRVP